MADDMLKQMLGMQQSGGFSQGGIPQVLYFFQSLSCTSAPVRLRRRGRVLVIRLGDIM